MSPLETEANSVRSPRRRWVRRVLGLGLLAILLAAIVTPLVLRQRRERAAVERELARLRAAGQPLSLADLRQLYPDPPPEKDFRAFFEPLIQARYLTTEGWGDLKRWTAPAPFPEKAYADVTNNAPVIEAVLAQDLSLMRSRIDWPADGENFYACRIAEIPRLIELSSALGEQAVLDAHSGNLARAATAVVRGFAVAEMMPIGYVGAVCRMSCEHRTFNALAWVLSTTNFANADLRRLEAALPRPGAGILARAIQEERVGAVLLADMARNHPLQFERLAGVLGPGSGGNLLSLLLRNLPWTGQPNYRDGDFAASLSRYARQEEACAKPIPERLKIFREASSEFDTASSNTCRLVQLFELKLAPAAEEDAKLTALTAAAQVAIAVERWRSAHPGERPDSLSQLVPDYLPAVPLDPYDNQPLRYRKLDRGYLVYSVGPNFVDDGGRGRFQVPQGDAELDVTFTVTR